LEIELPYRELGTPVDFTSARKVGLSKFIFKDEIFGVTAYQAVPGTVDATIRNNFAGGNLDDLVAALEEAGMHSQYLKISWNEVQEGPVYVITDLVVGVVVSAASHMDISGQRLLDALFSVGWFNDFISLMSMPWQTYVLLTSVENEPFNRWNLDAAAEFSSKQTDEVPPIEETKTHFMEDGQVTAAVGEFVTTMVEEGYVTSVLRYSAHVGYETIKPVTYWGSILIPAKYRTHVRLSVDFTSDPECFITESPFALTAGVIVALGKAAALIIAAFLVGAGVFYALQNLTTQEESYEKWGWVQDPDTGEWEYKVIETGESKGPPEWWSQVIPIVTIGSVVVICVFGVAVVLPRILPAR
jgi:hypothetical protein